jgi:hypothetical protein
MGMDEYANMKPLVLQLQEDLVTGNVKLEQLLRLAKLIAGKLQIGPLERWIEYEIAGYPRKEGLPDYRIVSGGHLEVLNPYRGWIPVSGSGRKAVPMQSSISELEMFMKEDVVQFQPDRRLPVRDITGSGLLSGMPQRVLISTTEFRRIIEHVRGRLRLGAGAREQRCPRREYVF